MQENIILKFIGLGKMGKALVSNLISKGYKIEAFDKVKPSKNISKANLKIVNKLDDLFVNAQKPQTILLSIPEGEDLDLILDYLTSKLNSGDLIIDCGNSNFLKTIERSKKIEKRGIYFADFGVSGGPSGAKNSPSIMAGCSSPKAWDRVQNIASDLYNSRPFNFPSFRIGSSGAGHFVKMIHNAIEYAVMQMFAETVTFFDNSFIQSNSWYHLQTALRKSIANCYLLDITNYDTSGKNGTDRNLITNIGKKLKVKHNGTGVWALNHAYINNIPMPSIARAVEHRLLSTSEISNHFYSQGNNVRVERKDILSEKSFVKLLELAIVSAFIQGLSNFSVTEKYFKEELNPKETLELWDNRSVLRGEIISFLLNLDNSFFSNYAVEKSAVESFVNERLRILNALSSKSKNLAYFCPCIFSGLMFFVQSKENQKISNIINNQRNTFGGHKK